MSAMLSGFCEDSHVSEDIQNDLLIALEEILSNVIRHSIAVRAIRVDFACSGEAFHIRIVDDGAPFDPLAKPDPDVTLELDDRTPGGLGIFMVRQMMDDSSYRREGAHNVFEMSKNLSARN